MIAQLRVEGKGRSGWTRPNPDANPEKAKPLFALGRARIAERKGGQTGPARANRWNPCS